MYGEWLKQARSGKTRSPLPLTRRRRLHPSDRLSPILAHQLLASMMPSVKPENHRDPVVSGYPTSLPSKRLAAKSFQIDLGDTDTGGLLLVRSDSFFSAKGNKSIQLTMRLIQFRHSLMDWKESSTKVQNARKSLQKKDANAFSSNHRGVVLVTNVYSQTSLEIHESCSQEWQSSILCVTNIRMGNVLQRTLEVSRMLIWKMWVSALL